MRTKHSYLSLSLSLSLITHQFRGIIEKCPHFMKKNRKMSTCNRLDWETLGSPPIMSKFLPGHCSGVIEVAIKPRHMQ
jgi:hypothetical protein